MYKLNIQMLDIHCPIYSGAKIYFAQPDALRGYGFAWSFVDGCMG